MCDALLSAILLSGTIRQALRIRLILMKTRGSRRRVSTDIKRSSRAETFAEVPERLTWLERANVAFIRRTFDWWWLDRFCAWGCRVPGAGWVYFCTRRLLQVHGLDRLPPVNTLERVILVSNHRSMFDMYVINAVLYRRGFRPRLLFPVRANFFYDHWAGFFVNAVMSFWSMYPPIFRDRHRLSLNHTAMSELATAVANGRSAGIHPEGTRNLSDDPYTLLPAQNGIGRLIHQAEGATVIPAFINGLSNNLLKQIAGNFNGSGTPIHVVFGAPLDLDDLRQSTASTKTYRDIAQRTMTAISDLGQQERKIRAQES